MSLQTAAETLNPLLQGGAVVLLAVCANQLWRYRSLDAEPATTSALRE